jgi:hypothetical protein
MDLVFGVFGVSPVRPFLSAVKALPGIFTCWYGFLIDTGKPVAGHGFFLCPGI